MLASLQCSPSKRSVLLPYVLLGRSTAWELQHASLPTRTIRFGCHSFAGSASTAVSSPKRYVRPDRAAYSSRLYLRSEMSTRRESWARVAAGSAGSNPSSQAPARAGAFSHLANSSTPHSISQNRHSRSLDADGHHNSMSTSWGRGGALPSYSSHSGFWQGLGPTQDIPAFFVPSYLRGSRHAERLQEAHKAKLAAQREYKSAHSSNAPSLSTSSSSANLHKMGPSHRGLSHDVIERAPAFVDEPVAHWPTRWNEADKFAQLELEENGCLAKFSGTQKAHDEAAAVRADFPMPRQCGIYYFEVTVTSKGRDG